jgi:hypothetical protein
MNFPCYFQEGSTPQSGIDTITVWLHPSIINQVYQFHERGNNNQPINLRYKKEIAYITNTPIRTNYYVDIQAEAINPNNDILDQVLTILVDLAYHGILHYPLLGQYTNDLKRFFKLNFNRLFSLDRLDFYFDLRDGDMRLLGTPNPVYPNTRYSSKNEAVLKAYSRTAKLRQKRCIPYKDIENMDYPNRIEISLRRDNCDYLNAYNLTGSYENVFLWHLPLLARKWQNYRHKVVEVQECNLSYAHHLCKVIAVARQRIPQYNDLLRTPIKPIPYKKTKRNEVDYNFIPQFYSRV